MVVSEPVLFVTYFYRAALSVRMGVSFTAIFDMFFQGVLKFHRVGVVSEKLPLVRK
jgi:hypothetical protein